MSVQTNYENPEAVIPKYNAQLNINFPNVKVGVAHYEEGPTGCTVVLFENQDGSTKDVQFYADKRGGAVGSIFDDWGIANAICFSGGSIFGLEACFGVMQYFHEKTNYSNNWMDIPDVPGAIIFDFGPRNNSIFPDKKLGYFASKNAKENVIPIGPFGAGRFATVGKGFDYSLGEFSGQGASYRQIGEIKILALTVVNAIGAIRDRDGKIVLGHLDRSKNERIEILKQIEGQDNNTSNSTQKEEGNTTLTLIITNQKLSRYHLKQISRQVHSSMARMIDPFHTSSDGDILFFVTTGEIESQKLTDVQLGMITTEVLWDAVLSLVK